MSSIACTQTLGSIPGFDLQPQQKVRKQNFSSSINCSNPSSSSPSSSAETKRESSIRGSKGGGFRYSRACPSVRWPNTKHEEITQSGSTHLNSGPNLVAHLAKEAPCVENGENFVRRVDDGKGLVGNGESSRVFRRQRVGRLCGLGLGRDENERHRVKILADRIIGLRLGEPVGGVLEAESGRMIGSDYCFLVKSLGKYSWKRAVEVYECLRVKQADALSSQLLVVILSVLGKAKQEALAEEIFARRDYGEVTSVEVYNAMMGVYAQSGRFIKVQELMKVMRERGCHPDVVSFNTLINARFKSGPMEPNLLLKLLGEMRRSQVQPDVITYNTLLSVCSRYSNLEEAVKVCRDMEAQRCSPDLWTYNAMISVFGRCGQGSKAESLLRKLQSKGFNPDAFTYNSVLYAYAREGDVEKVRDICIEMVDKGFQKSEVTYNTMIHMYGKKGEYESSLQLYEDMKLLGLTPDEVTYTTLIDLLGKANKMAEAENLMSEMLDAGVEPSLCTYSAVICGYAKARKLAEADHIMSRMLESGIKPDHQAYSIMMNVLVRSNKLREAVKLHKEMLGDGFIPNPGINLALIEALKKEYGEPDIQKVTLDLEKLCGLNPLGISSVLVGESHDTASPMMKLMSSKVYNDLDQESLLAISSQRKASGPDSKEEESLIDLEKRAASYRQLAKEAMVVVLCRAKELDAAMKQYGEIIGFGFCGGSVIMYETLLKCCEESESYADASQIFTDLRFHGIEPSKDLYQTMVKVYCKMGFPETAQKLLHEAETKGIMLTNVDIFVGFIDAYMKCKEFKRAEGIVGLLRKRSKVMDRKVWNALIRAYAGSGYYEQARAAFNTMMRDGPDPNADTIDGLVQALIVDSRLEELYVVVQELQDMGFKIGRSSILLMLDAFVQAGNIFEVKKIYHGMTAAGCLPTVDLYKAMIGLLSRGKQIWDVEMMVEEMEEVGFKPDLVIWNSLLKLYVNFQECRKATELYEYIKKDGIKPDDDTFNTLIVMHCRDCRPEEGLSLLHEMQMLGLDPTLDTYKSLIAALAKKELLQQAEDLFNHLRSKQYKLDRSFYHLMIKMYRKSGSYSKAEELLVLMVESGIEPSEATHLLMISYGSEQPLEAEKLLYNIKSHDISVGTLAYYTVIDAYFKSGDYNGGIQKLMTMKEDGLEPDHRIWTCFLRAASLCQESSAALILLNALQDAGFNIPVRLLAVDSTSLVLEIDSLLERLQALEDDAAFNFVNALEDLLWAFEFRATASWLFQLAVKRNIYGLDVFRVAENDWGADFKKLSAGAALVGLTLWFDHMQDASLDGVPECPKSVLLATGAAECNMICLNSTVKTYLWEMGSPFFPCKSRSGVFVTKGHALRMWLKESPFCFDLELKNAPSLPEWNSMQLVEGRWMRRGLVPVFKDIMTRLGEVPPKKFARLALLSDEKRDEAIQADIEGRNEKMEKMMKRDGLQRVMRKPGKRHQRRFIRRSNAAKS
ncbi:hypothetical protein Drorol1_Dr00013004 [Drosera rotundifolia]